MDDENIISLDSLGSDVRKACRYFLDSIYKEWQKREQWDTSDDLPSPRSTKFIDVPIKPIRQWLKRNNYYDEDYFENTLYLLEQAGFIISMKSINNSEYLWEIGGETNADGDIIKETHFQVLVPEDFEQKYENLGKLFKEVASQPLRKNNTVQANETKNEQPRISFNPSTGKIILGARECPIPLSSNQYQVCKFLFEKPLGEWLEETKVADSFYRGEGARSFYDAIRLINIKVKECLKIEQLLEFRAARVRIRTEAIQ